MSDDMDTDLTAVRIKHLGQCPYEKGHEKCGDAFFGGLMVGFFGTMILLAILSSWLHVDRAAEAIKLGYALHDPITGEFVWRQPPSRPAP